MSPDLNYELVWARGSVKGYYQFIAGPAFDLRELTCLRVGGGPVKKSKKGCCLSSKMDYVETRDALLDFLISFRDTSATGNQNKYARALQSINLRQSRVLVIELDDILAHSKDDALSRVCTCHISTLACFHCSIFRVLQIKSLEMLHVI
jgi:hypothetical protein